MVTQSDIPPINQFQSPPQVIVYQHESTVAQQKIAEAEADALAEAEEARGGRTWDARSSERWRRTCRLMFPARRTKNVA